jgi:hypothetical protein
MVKLYVLSTLHPSHKFHNTENQSKSSLPPIVHVVWRPSGDDLKSNVDEIWFPIDPTCRFDEKIGRTSVTDYFSFNFVSCHLRRSLRIIIDSRKKSERIWMFDSTLCKSRRNNIQDDQNLRWIWLRERASDVQQITTSWSNRLESDVICCMSWINSLDTAVWLLESILRTNR